MKRKLNKGFAIALPILVFVISGCAGLRDDQTVGLFGKATHTGTASLYRADLSRVVNRIGESSGTTTGNDDYAGQRGRFAALREKGDYSGLDTSDRIITADDTITLTLNGGFIKYFREKGGDMRKGEIALVLSFDAGTERAVNEDHAILIYSSQGQTLGSFLDLTDWKILGPMVVAGDSLRLRVVMLEWDQQENEAHKELVRSLAATATNFVPGVGGHLAIANSLANFIIDQNRDDTIVDQRFALQRVQTGGRRSANPLLAGTYVLMLQEDSLANVEVAGTLPSLPPVVNDLRFDYHSGRIYKRYDYIPGLSKDDGTTDCGEPGTIDDNNPEAYDLTYGAKLYPGRSWVGFPRFFYQDAQQLMDKSWDESPKYKKCVLEKWINGKTALEWRREALGYREPYIGEFELLSTLDAALHEAFVEGIRHARHKTAEQATSKVIERLLRDTGYNATDLQLKLALPYNYKVVIYPKAFAVMAEYPLHTHLVFTIEHSLGSIGEPYHRHFARYLNVLDEEKKRARDHTRLATLTKQIEAVRKAMARQSTVFNQVDNMPSQQVGARTCMLLPLLKPENVPVPLSAADVYNKLFDVTGESFEGLQGVLDYLTGKGCTAAKDYTCNCTGPSG